MEGDFVIGKDRKQLIQYFGSWSQIVIPKSVELIGAFCFSWCELKPLI
jgi:hypothetical protein